MTRRPHSAALDAILGDERRVLDHGFIRVVDYMGNDDAIVQAARVSYGTGTKSVSDDRGLIRYLLRNRHTTPFEMAEIKLHIKLPIFVARQWIRHRMASVNEYSGRYSVLDREFYVPRVEAVASQHSKNRQGREDSLPELLAEAVVGDLRESAEAAYDLYTKLLGGEGEQVDQGVARELARIILPVSFYTQWYWKIDLHNLLHFLELRADTHAQWEIREYAVAILEIVKSWVPNTYEAFTDYRLEGYHLSKAALEAVQKMLAGEIVTQETSGLTKREWAELSAALASR